MLPVIKSLRAICDAHESEYGTPTSTPAGPVTPWSDVYASPPASPGRQRDLLAPIKLRLMPLLALESTLASRIGSGFNLGGRTEVCVRRGWQDSALWSRSGGKRKGRSRSGSADGDRTGKAPESELHSDLQLVLADARQDIEQLWAHASVRGLIQRRKLKLEDASVL